MDNNETGGEGGGATMLSTGEEGMAKEESGERGAAASGDDNGKEAVFSSTVVDNESSAGVDDASKVAEGAACPMDNSRDGGKVDAVETDETGETDSAEEAYGASSTSSRTAAVTANNFARKFTTWRSQFTASTATAATTATASTTAPTPPTTAANKAQAFFHQVAAKTQLQQQQWNSNPGGSAFQTAWRNLDTKARSVVNNAAKKDGTSSAAEILSRPFRDAEAPAPPQDDGTFVKIGYEEGYHNHNDGNQDDEDNPKQQDQESDDDKDEGEDDERKAVTGADGKDADNKTPASKSIAAAAAAASAAAVSVADSVSQGFRGRYAYNPSTAGEKSAKSPLTTSETAAVPRPVATAAQNIFDGMANLRTQKKRDSSSGRPNSPNQPDDAGPPPTQGRLAVAASAAAAAAASATRGTPSQTALILQSTAASHMHSILSKLEPGQFVMLLGYGLMGVNLKQPYSKNLGVYVDFIVPGGAADKSAVVSVGDSLIRVGDVDVTRGTIRDVPRTIANAKRPVVLVLRAGAHVDVDRMDYIDIAVGMANRLREERLHANDNDYGTDDEDDDDEDDDDEKPTATTDDEAQTSDSNRGTLRTGSSLLDNDEEDDAADDKRDDRDKTDDFKKLDNDESDGKEKLADETKDLSATEVVTEKVPSSKAVENADGCNNTETSDVNRPDETRSPCVEVTTTAEELGTSNEPVLASPPRPAKGGKKKVVLVTPNKSEKALSWKKSPVRTTPPSPPSHMRKALAAFANKRNNSMTSYSALAYAAVHDEVFRVAMRNAFLTCCLDCRRFPFLASHYSSDDVGSKTFLPNDPTEEKELTTATESTLPQSVDSIHLMLYLDLLSYRDLYGVAPANRRIGHVKRIAYKFLLPKRNVDDGVEEPPMFDLRPTVPIKAINDLEEAIVDKGKLDFRGFGRNIFYHVEWALEASLAGPKFASFLVSDECARMRAYLRGTSPYINVPIEGVIDGVTKRETSNPMAHNHLVYIMIYLISQHDRGPASENDKSDDDETAGKRLIGSAFAIACALYIQRDFSRVVDAASDALRDLNGGEVTESQGTVLVELLRASEFLWETFVAPAGGSLDALANSNEVQTALNDVRRALVQAITMRDTDSGWKSRGLSCISALVSEQFVDPLRRLSEELLFGYAANHHARFRGHKMHEWLCGEINTFLVTEMDGDSDKEDDGDGDDGDDEVKDDTKDEKEDSNEVKVHVPSLPAGSITRLLRRITLPDGVSKHIITEPKGSIPMETGTSKIHEVSNETTSPDHVNAEFAVVFGSDIGMDSAGRLPNPAMSASQGVIRRFACVPLGDKHDERLHGLIEADIPPTLESYAIVPSFQQRPFSDLYDVDRISDDGWEVSLINFVVPSSQSSMKSSADGSNEEFIFGVSLVFNLQQEPPAAGTTAGRGRANESDYITELVKAINVQDRERTTRRKFPSRQSYVEEENIVFVEAGDTAPLFADEESHVEDEAHTVSQPFVSPISLDEDAKTGGGSLRSNLKRRIEVAEETPEFNRRLSERRWSKQMKNQDSAVKQKGITVGVALLSSKNTIASMRQTLSLFFEDASRSRASRKGDKNVDKVRLCDPIVDILGNLSFYDVETVSISFILEPYIEFTKDLGLGKSLELQKKHFENEAGRQLLSALPPIPLALLFIVVMLEQKIVLSSSRRSLLLSVATSITCLLKPLHWAHLFVPLVPSALAEDLVQYPAPFIVGIPSDDEGSMELLSSLPEDVTLVDLDVGRVILAGSLSTETEGAQGPGALRSQVLYLAESFGGVLGAHTERQSWRCDGPTTLLTRGGRFERQGGETRRPADGFAAIHSVCESFIMELLSGISSCCFWIEEMRAKGHEGGERCILFDEDRYFHVKNLRSQGLYKPLLMGETITFHKTERIGASDVVDEGEGVARYDGGGRLQHVSNFSISLDDFDLVLESFLRCQSVSTYISSLPKETMAFR